MKPLKLVVLIVLVPFLSFGWNSNGHSTCGAVAYYYLKANSPATIKKVTDILEKHPWYTTEWAKRLKGLKGESRDVALFMLASTFPDEARSTIFKDKSYDSWHYINYPFHPGKPEGKLAVQPTPNAENKLISLLAIIGKEPDAKDIPLDLCWIFHLTEDLHQPLHSTAMFDENHPKGDQGGNLVLFKIVADSPATKLHSFWDALMTGSFTTTPAKAKKIFGMKEYKESALEELKQNTTITEWVQKESYPQAIKYAYLDGKMNGYQDHPNLAPAGYKEKSAKIAERRVVLAGIRLGKFLKDSLK